MPSHPWYDEEKEISTFWSWVFLIVYCLAIMAFGLVVYLIIPDGTRRWSYGTLPDPPAASIYHDRQPPAGASGKQIVPIPEAKPDTRISGESMKGKRQ